MKKTVNSKYFKIYYSYEFLINDLKLNELKVLLFLGSIGDYDNKVSLSTVDREEIYRTIRIKQRMLYVILNKLKEKNLIIKLGNSLFMINPNIIWRGMEEKRLDGLNTYFSLSSKGELLSSEQDKEF